jgi:lysyl oxidase
MKRLGVLLAASSLVLMAIQVPASALPAGEPHYPDLITRPPSSVRLATGKGTSGRKLFFANTIGNVGAGPLELRAENDAATATTNAIQEIYTHSSTTGIKGSRLTLVSSTLVGTFVFHPAHNHWHMADFARYELRSINADGSTGPVVAATDKVSFCMIDTDVIDSTLPDYNMGLSHSCGQNARQGIRVGRGDTYSASLPDQFIDISAVPDGTYRLMSVADPNTTARPGGRLLEMNNSNNAASVDVIVTRSAVTIVPGTAQTGIDAPP